MDGTSFAYTFDRADAAERHTVQYFEFMGSQAIYQDGWWACVKMDRVPWNLSPPTLKPFGPGSGYDPEQDTWELYYLPDDFSQAHDLATQQPEKLAELKDLFWAEAERNRVLPLFGAAAVFSGMLPPLPTITRFTFAGDVQNVQRAWCPASSGGRMRSRPSWRCPRPAPRASSSPTPTSSAGSRCGSTATGDSTTRTHSSAWRPTTLPQQVPRRSQPRPSQPVNAIAWSGAITARDRRRQDPQVSHQKMSRVVQGVYHLGRQGPGTLTAQ